MTSVCSACVSHIDVRSFPVTAIPPTPPLVLVRTYEETDRQTDMPVTVGTLRKQREAQRRVNCGPVGCQQRIVLQSVSHPGGRQSC